VEEEPRREDKVDFSMSIRSADVREVRRRLAVMVGPVKLGEDFQCQHPWQSGESGADGPS